MVRIQKRLKGTFNLQRYDIDTSLPAMEILKKLPEKFPAEVIDSKLYVHEPVTMYHVRSGYDLEVKLRQYVRANKLGEMFHEPGGVYFEGRKHAVMPDIFFLSRERSHLVKPKGLFGAPDLVIEVLSPGTRQYNFTTKKDLYEKYGVKEYWLVDPISKEAYGFLLRDNKYHNPLILKGKINIRIFKKSFKI